MEPDESSPLSSLEPEDPSPLPLDPELEPERNSSLPLLPELPLLRLEEDEHHHHKDVYEHSLKVL